MCVSRWRRVMSLRGLRVLGFPASSKPLEHADLAEIGHHRLGGSV